MVKVIEAFVQMIYVYVHFFGVLIPRDDILNTITHFHKDIKSITFSESQTLTALSYS